MEDDDTAKVDILEKSKSRFKDDENNKTDQISAKNVEKLNKDEENIPSISSTGSGESCSRVDVENNQLVMKGPCGSGDSRNGDSDEEKSKKQVVENAANQSEHLDKKDISSTSKEQEGMSYVTEYGKSKRGISEGQESGDSRVSMDELKSSADTESSKRQRTDETMNGSSNGVDRDEVPSKFFKLKSKVRKRNYRVKQNIPDEPAADNNSDELVVSETDDEEMETDDAGDTSSDQDSVPTVHEDSNLIGEEIAEDDDEEVVENSDLDEDGEDRDDDDSNERTSASEDDSEDRVPAVLRKEKPKPQWFIVPEVIKRQLGCNELFQRRFYGSLHTVQRLELMYKLKEHEGCVNTLSFNQRGNLLASGSDDLTVVIWDWPLGKKHHSFKTGHRSNVFQASWLPLPSENLMVTCARDGHVRLADLHKSSEDCTRRLASHKGSATKLSIHPDVPHVILSVGEDAKVFAIDIRESKPTTLLSVKEGLSQVAIYSVNSNPLNSNEFCLGGKDQFVRVYDKRKVSSPSYKLCPENLRNNKNHAHVTCAIYNYNGSEILASYNDEDIYLFDTLLPYPIGDFAHKYQGHRNNATVKGVNFFGPKSEFIISGSDCGNIYIWEKNTEAIVQWMAGDEYGVVNRLEPHPHIPVLATSGLDYDVKVWVPSCEEPPPMKNLETCVRYNMKSRARDVSREPDAFGGQLLWFLWRHATETQEPRSRGNGLGRNGDAREEEEAETSSDDDTSNNSNSPSEYESDGRPRCSPP